MMSASRCLLAVLLLGLALPAAALESDAHQPIHIKADRVRLNEKTGISEYLGAVRLSQGSIVITADSIVVHQPQGRLQKILVTGRPARFRQDSGVAGQLIDAQAARMEYLAGEERLFLSGKALVIQGPNQFAGEYIEFDTRNSTVTAQGAENPRGQVDVTIQPAPPAEAPAAAPATPAEPASGAGQ